MTDGFKAHNKQIVILADSGKPVFTRHADDEGESAATCAFLRGLLAKVEASATLGELREFSCAGGLRVVFLRRDPGRLLFVCLARTGESLAYLRKQLHLLHMHVLMHTTRPGLERLFASNPSYDLSGLLAGTELETRNLIRLANRDFGLMTDAVSTAAMPRATRQVIYEALREAAGTEALFGIVLTGSGKFVCGVSNLSSAAPPQALDLALLANFTQSARGQLTKEGETWTPLCLPEFNDSGHTHAYCTYLAPPDSASSSPFGLLCLLLLYTDANLDFFHLAAKRKEVFGEKVLKAAFTEDGRLVESASEAMPGACEAEGAIHFLAVFGGGRFCKRQCFETAVVVVVVSMMMTEEEPKVGGREEGETESREARRRRKALLRAYSALVVPHESSDVPVAYLETGEECLMRVTFPQHELEILAAFPPLTPPAHCAATMNRARGWVLDHKNDLFFTGGRT